MQTTSVSPYNNKYEPVHDVPIVTGATAVQLPETGETVILVINQALWFGDTLPNSLLNPNQLRHYGTDVQDNPFDRRGLYIAADDGTQIPMTSLGTTILFESQTPTQSKLETCRHINLTSDVEWDPRNISFPNSHRKEEEYPYISAISQFSTIADISVLEDVPSPRTFLSSERKTDVLPAALSEHWQIGMKQATQTLRVTTQRGVRSAIQPLLRRYRTDRMFLPNCLRGQRFYTDTLFFSHKSLDGNTCAQVFSNDSLFASVYPMESKALAGDALKQFIADFGAMDEIVMDGAGKQVGKRTTMMKTVKKYDINYHITEPGRHNQNRAEGVIREIKKKWFRVMNKKEVPKRLWDYGIKWVSEIMRMTANSVRILDGRTPLEEVTGETPDISEYLDFGFYDYVWYMDSPGHSDRSFGRWLGISHCVGSQMCYFVIKLNGKVESRTSVQRVTNLKLQTEEVKRRCEEFNKVLEDRLRDEQFVISEGARTKPTDWRMMDLDSNKDYNGEFNNVVSDPAI